MPPDEEVDGTGWLDTVDEQYEAGGGGIGAGDEVESLESCKKPAGGEGTSDTPFGTRFIGCITAGGGGGIIVALVPANVRMTSGVLANGGGSGPPLGSLGSFFFFLVCLLSRPDAAAAAARASCSSNIRSCAGSTAQNQPFPRSPVLFSIFMKKRPDERLCRTEPCEYRQHEPAAICSCKLASQPPPSLSLYHKWLSIIHAQISPSVALPSYALIAR
jgi:hypothetical protein